LKKQSQFGRGLNQRKLLYERRLWQYTSLRGTKKQSQFDGSWFIVHSTEIGWIPISTGMTNNKYLRPSAVNEFEKTNLS
jgi:hypothetical protein